MAEYIVTVAQGVDWRNVHNDLIRDTSTDDSVDSNIVPDRACECITERIYSRNTHYELTDQEAEQLRNDPRIVAVAKPPTFRPSIRKQQSLNGNRNWISSGRQENWGLARHTISAPSSEQVFEKVTNGTYDYVLDGTGVDVVIMDTGIQANHPEWEDENGSSRLQQINWYSAAGLSGSNPAGFYTDQEGHGTHVASTVAGKKFGWAKNANIYSMKIDLAGVTNGPISTDPDSNGYTAYDLVKLWHKKKNDPNDASYTGRPTVVNMSFGWSLQINKNVNPITVYGYPVTEINYRGVRTTDCSMAGVRYKGVNVEWQGAATPYQFASEDAEVEDLLAEGIHICVAAGNDGFQIDLPSGLDYNNYLVLADTHRVYYNRPGTPYANGVIMVGCLDNQPVSGSQEQRVYFSNTGPATDIYTAGEAIIGAVPDAHGVDYFYDANFRQEKYQGTSMASPQMAGMVALALQVHPSWTPAQMRNWFLTNATTDTMFGGADDFPWTNPGQEMVAQNVLYGGTSRVAYFPMHGSKPYGFNSSS